ncbi:Ubiquitin--protein ligase [Handroanthus impetiginosus]|uniref:RBR-type E3 ubiquitin transferase n=1 Tax=Handroanthus impetiginosus TaxID=429701 RepID=A0A2G9GDH9_9LAMI|nr:Ubiquitin--protein ligase [Handroanthus impetiginosus]
MKVNLAALAKGTRRLLKKFIYVRATRREHKNIKVAQESSKKTTDTCKICFAETYVDQMFLVPSCHHSYCLACMSDHVEYKLLDGVLPKCPHENCKTELQPDCCKEFLSPNLVIIMSQRMKEASIPAQDRIYCPNPRCSALFSRTKLQGSKKNSTRARKCPNCKNPCMSREERELRWLASRERWRQCPKCRDMVSLASGCYHIYCRCGHQFCYKCGAKWGHGRPTCRCPIWDERNIIYAGQNVGQKFRNEKRTM